MEEASDRSHHQANKIAAGPVPVYGSNFYMQPAQHFAQQQQYMPHPGMVGTIVINSRRLLNTADDANDDGSYDGPSRI